MHSGARMLARPVLFALTLSACNMAASPPPSRNYYAPVQPPPTASPTAAAPAPAPPPRDGVLRLDAVSTSCSDIAAVHDDGGAGVMCTIARENACAIRQLGPDGQERGRSDLVPGQCARWVPRTEGGGVLVTHSQNYLAVTFTAIDSHGKKGASTSLTSPIGVYLFDAVPATDGGVFAAVSFNEALEYKGKKLGTTKHSTTALVRVAPSLDRLVWSRLFSTRRTSVPAMLPPSDPDRVDVVMQTRGPLVPGTPVNPPVNPNDGSIYGGDSYGWRTERITFDGRGKPGRREELGKGKYAPLTDAALIGGQLATLAYVPPDYRTRTLAFANTSGERVTQTLGGQGSKLITVGGRTWVLECACSWDSGKRTGTWYAHEVGGAGAKINLGDAGGENPTQWATVAMRDENVVAVGVTKDAVTGLSVTVTALLRAQPDAPAVDLARLERVDAIGIDPSCQSKRTDIGVTIAKVGEYDAALEKCGVPRNARVNLGMLAEGGLHTFAVEGQSDAVSSCARAVLAPLFTCPPTTGGGGTSFVVRK